MGARIKKRFFLTIKELRYAGFLTTHPAKGFWEIKHENEGSLFTSFLILGATIVILVLSNLNTGFLFGGPHDPFYNFIDTVISTSVLFFGWCIANWCLTCLFDGEGRLVDIMRATGYAMLPFAIIQTILIFLSNMFILREEVFYNMLNALSIVWMIGLIIMGVMITHQYAVFKSILVCLASVAVMLMIAFLILLFFNLMAQVVNFITIYIDEMTIRMAGGVAVPGGGILR